MYKWLPYALVRVTFFYCLGILLAIYQAELLSENEALILSLALTGVLLLSYITFKISKIIHFKLLFSVVAFSTLVSLGYFNLKLNDQSLKVNHISHFNEIEGYSALVEDNGYETEKTNRYLLKVNSVKENGWKKSSGQLYLYLAKDADYSLNYGDLILVNGRPNELSSPMNPGEFDYKRFLSFNNIDFQQYSTGENIQVVSSNNGNSLLAYVFQARKYVVNVLSQSIDSERELNIAMALVIGVKDGLSDEIKQAYSASGAMHVLAVSGLHVGIIYAILLLLFGKLQNHEKGRWYLAAVTLILLWSYAAITGFSPSVLRAVTMFSFVAVAKASSRTTNIYNTLAASAFVLLLFNPYLIMSVGFQLSYLAVLGIVYIQPKVYHLWLPSNYLLDKIWQITSVSIAAQLATFSLGLLYFHQFPTFFLLSNLVVIPGAFLVLLGGILTIITSFYLPLSSFIGMLLKWLIFGINEVVFWIEKLPHSIIEHVYFNTLETWLIIGILLSLLLAGQLRSRKLIYLSVLLAAGFSISKWNYVYSNQIADKLTVYRVNNHLALEFISQGKSEIYTDSALFFDSDKMRFHIEPNQLRSGIFQSSLQPRREGNSFEWVIWEDKKILILNNRIDLNILRIKEQCDILLLADNFSGDLSKLNGIVNFELLILDGSLKYYRADKLYEKAKELDYPVYSVYHNGAYQQTI